MTSPNHSNLQQLEPKPETVEAECPQHGKYLARIIRLFEAKPMQSKCPTCVQEAQVREERRRADEAAAEKSRKVQVLFSKASIPERFRERRLSNYEAETAGQKRALEIAQRFVSSEDRGVSLVLCGKPGTGKTHLACGIASALIEKMRSAMFCTVLSAIRHVKDTYRRDSERSESDAIADLLQPDLLILDEVGIQIGSEHEKMILFEIINERYQECRSTILISNLSREGLTEYLGERIMDRFREAGAVIAFDWQSYRGRKAA